MRIIISSVPVVISPPSLTRQESNFAIRRCQSRIEFWVEIYRGEKEGGLKTVEFEKCQAALEFAELSIA
jgi:hypothetical protein